MMREVLIQKDSTYRPADDAVTFDAFLLWEIQRERELQVEIPNDTCTEIEESSLRPELSKAIDSIPSDGLYL